MSIKVCDALCGCGKTSACINMMNEEVGSKFIFVTQYLDEVKRIIKGCDRRGFVQPERDEKTGLTKLEDIQYLISQGKNIATTHALFLSYTDETKQMIKDQEYTLVLDEVVDVAWVADISKADMDLLRKGEMIEEDGEYVKWIGESYVGETRGKFRDEMLRARSHNFLRYDEKYFFWSITPELFTSFKDVYILTYQFHVQNLRCFFEMHSMEYEYIGARKAEGGYVFCPAEQMNRARELRDKIHILENRKINSIGDGRTALSFSWYRKMRLLGKEGSLPQLRKNISNVFKNIFKATSREVLWTAFKGSTEQLLGKGYSGAFIPYNLRASNEYSSRKYLAYCVNNFPRPWEVRYYREHGVEVDADGYALSILIQWIFRSAIRNNEEVWLYLPSARMRSLLIQWLNNLAEGNDLAPVSYKTPRKSYYKPVSDKKSKR